jgi:hypothetical protein
MPRMTRSKHREEEQREDTRVASDYNESKERTNEGTKGQVEVGMKSSVVQR